MPVPLGFVPGTRIRTPRGEVAIEQLSVGDTITSFDPATAVSTEVAVAEIRRGEAVQLVTVVLDGHELRGITPGTSVWDAFEESFRAAGSLSTLSELVVVGRGALSVQEVPERAATGPVVHLVLEAPHESFVADDVVVRSKEAR